MSKVSADFTATPICRLPVICGGMYYVFNLVMNQASVFAAVHLYIRYAVLPDKLDESLLWTGVLAMTLTWIFTFGYFAFRVAVPSLRHTLWSRTSGRQVVQEYFLNGKDDEGMFEIYNNNLLLWESDIGEDVKAWTAENWARWKEEMPAWFKVELVPDRFIPDGELQELGHNRKRRGSAAASIMESYREVSVWEGSDEN
jgi:hypothetical protein